MIDRRYIGMLQNDQEPCDAFKKYVGQKTEEQEREDRLAEFRKCLHETSLESDDVAGIRKASVRSVESVFVSLVVSSVIPVQLAESAHIASTIRSGPYRGLPHNQSAIEATTLVHEQFNALSSLSERPEFSGGFQMVDVELRRRGFYTEGVREAVKHGWEQQKIAKQQFAEVVDTSKLVCQRSDLTTPDSLKVYTSLFANSKPLSQPQHTYINGDIKRSTSSTISSTRELQSVLEPAGARPFVERAAKIGITIRSHVDIANSCSPPLFEFERKSCVPEGFEQINEDLFARNDNRFIVFNGAGVDCWHGSQPVTKVLTFEAANRWLETLGQSVALEGQQV